MTNNRFPNCPYPRINVIFRAGERVWARRQGVDRAFPVIDTPAFWYWLMWYGPWLFPEVQRNLYAFPLDALRARVIGEHATLKDFNQSGLVDWRRIEGLLREAGFNFTAGERVLDFGCGCGRILRHFAYYAGRSQFTGVDVDGEAVAWADLHFDFAHAQKVPLMPPLPYPNDHFGAIYAFSVFSHLPESAAQAWLAELRRILRPGGFALLTVQGEHVMNCLKEGRVDLGAPTPTQLQRDEDKIHHQGFAFYPYGDLAAHANIPLDGAHYGNAITLPHYIKARWTEHFHLRAIHPAPDAWQDYILLQG